MTTLTTTTPLRKTKVTLKKNGPIRLEGDFEVYDANGNLLDLNGKTAIALCRCGESAKKPFCDGAHNQCNFQSESSD